MDGYALYEICFNNVNSFCVNLLRSLYLVAYDVAAGLLCSDFIFDAVAYAEKLFGRFNKMQYRKT